MSRIVVKQLPKNIGEEKLRTIFGSKGTITDIQLKYTHDGKFRQFCFIGYRNQKEAEDAIRFFNNTCIQASRIKVEFCASLGGDEKPQSWSKYAKDSKKNIMSHEKEITKIGKKINENEKKKISKLDEIFGEHKNDPEFLDFMKSHDKSRTLWENDAGIIEKSTTNQSTHTSCNIATRLEYEFVPDSKISDKTDDNHELSNVKNFTKLATKPISDLEYMNSLKAPDATESSDANENNLKPDKAKAVKKNDIDLFTIKVHNVPYKTKRQDVLKFFKPLKPYSVRLPTNEHGFCYVGFKTKKEMDKGMIKNKSFINGKQVFFSDFTEKNKISKSNGSKNSILNAHGNTTNLKWQQQAESIRNQEHISESGCIFFRNLPYTTTEKELQQLFEQFGPIADINLPVDSVTRQIKGFGTVTFMMPEHAVQSFNKLDGADFHGRLLHLIPGKSSVETKEDAELNDADLSFKQMKTMKLKKNAQQSVNWNTLFLGANAVADILSNKFNTSKEKILDTIDGGSSAAVRIALGETQIVMKMKEFMEDQGVCLAALDNVGTTKTKRSKTVMLVKNLPADTSVAELTPIFSKFGPIGRIILPPSGVTAIIEFCDPYEARHAFKKLAYSKFKSVPLFLEWAPEQIFATTHDVESQIPQHKEEEPPTKVPEDETKDDQVTEEVVEKDGDDNVDPPEEKTTIFLRNLNFKTVQETVYNHFKSLGTIHTVEIAKRRDPDQPRQLKSLGYGFIQFKKTDVAELALKRMQFTNIDGNQVELKRSDRLLKSQYIIGQERKVNSTKQTGTKILVRNIPFQAKVKEVTALFKAFGELRSVRLPMKITPGEDAHRGFGFVDFITKSDAKKAFDALSQSTHLYGRRLVLEWAATSEEDVDELRKRTANKFGNSENDLSTKRHKRALFDIAGDMRTMSKASDDENDA